MNISLYLPPEVLDDEADSMPMTTPRQQSFNQLMEWRVFLRILQALCTAYGWTLEMDRRADPDLSCAIFADSVWVDEAAANLNEEALSDLPF
jgi:hypothetical protein